MKIKPIKKEKNILEMARYNANVIGTHLSIEHGVSNQDKKNFASLCMLGIMSQTESFNKTIKELEDTRLYSVVNRLMNKSYMTVDNTFLRDDRKGL